MLRWLNVVFGAWFVVTAFLVGQHAPEFGDHLFLGLAIFLFAFMSMALPTFRIANVLLGLWAIVSPFVFRYASTPFAVHDMVLGILVAWVALTPSRPHRRLAAAA